MCMYEDCQRLQALIKKIHQKVPKHNSYILHKFNISLRGALVGRSLKAAVSNYIFIVQRWILVARKEHPNRATENSFRKRIQINYR